MIEFKSGDILSEKTEAIVNPVNCAGVSGQVGVYGPEELFDMRTVGDLPFERWFELSIGCYRLIVAQAVVDDTDDNPTQRIDLFVDPVVKPLTRSAILVRDDQLDPPEKLIEDDAPDLPPH